MLPGSLIDAWLLEALIAATAGDRFAARRALQIALAEPLDGLRPFVQHRRASAKLLAHHHGSFGASDDLADRALTARRESEEAILSAHELTVLEMLSSMRSLSENRRRPHRSPGIGRGGAGRRQAAAPTRPGTGE